MDNRITNKTILVCGALAYDRIMDFPGRFSQHILAGKTHILNLSFTVESVKESFGGTAGNIAYNLALLGERPKVIAVAGRDFAKYKAWLIKNKIDISGVKIMKDELTASAHIMTDQDDNQITAYWPGGNEYNAFLDSRLRGNDKLAIIAPDTVARMVRYAKIFRQNRLAYIFDPGQQAGHYGARELEDSIKGAFMLIGNDYEIELVRRKLGVKLHELAKRAKILVITKGGQGADMYHENKKIFVPAAKKKVVVDPTGAGDALRAGFIKGLVMELELPKCARLGMAAAAYAVESKGTQEHRFTWQMVKRRYEENYGEKI